MGKGKRKRFLFHKITILTVNKIPRMGKGKRKRFLFHKIRE